MQPSIEYRDLYLASFEERTALEAKLLDAEAKRAACIAYADELYNELDAARNRMVMAERAAEKRGEIVRSLSREVRHLSDVLHRLRAREQMHLNPPDLLPPVGCPLLIQVEPGKLVKVSRTGFIQNRSAEMEYVTMDGQVVMGRFPWTYP